MSTPGVSPRENEDSGTTHHEAAYNYVPEEVGTTTRDHQNPAQNEQNEEQSSMLGERRGEHQHQNASSSQADDITAIAYRDSQSFTIDKHFAQYKLYYIFISLFIMLIVVFVLLGAGAKETPPDSNCATIFNGTCRGFLTLVDGDDWQLFGDFVGCPVSQKCVSRVGVSAYTDNCSWMLDQLWARPPLNDHRIGGDGDTSNLEESCCRAVANTYLIGFGELLLQAFLTTLVAMFLNSPFPLLFFRWVREKCSCSQVACCCFCGIAFDDEDSRDRIDAWNERKDEMSSRRIERSSLMHTTQVGDIEDDVPPEPTTTASITSNLQQQQSENNDNNNKKTDEKFHFTWIDYLFIPSSLYKYKIAVQVILQSWIALFISFSDEGYLAPSTHTLGSAGFYRYCAMVAKVLNAGSFITLVEFLSIVACYHLIELRRTSLDPKSHKIESVSHFNKKVSSLFVTPKDEQDQENIVNQMPWYGRVNRPGQWLMWFAVFSLCLTLLPAYITHVLVAQVYFLPWLCILAAAFVGVFALIFWIVDSWCESFYPIYFSDSQEEQERARKSDYGRKTRIFFAVVGRFTVVIAVNLIFLNVYLAPLNGMQLTYLFGYQGNGYVQVMFDESSMHSSTCSMKYGQARNFGEVIYAILLYV